MSPCRCGEEFDILDDLFKHAIHEHDAVLNIESHADEDGFHWELEHP